jgi:hypothetical protein
MNANELADELKEISLIADNHTKIVLGIAETMLRQQQAEIEALKKEKWLTEIDAKQQALKQIIDWMVLEHDTLACSSYPILKKASEK